jgi:single-strand DNA-binding protein
MNETYVTFTGWLGSDVETREVGDATVATFRVGSTPRRYNARERTWGDGETAWYTVNAWRGLGEHCVASLKRSDPVVVYGKQSVQVWKDTDGHERQTLRIEAFSVGHDLSKGTSTFSKAVRAAAADDSALRELNASFGAGGPQVSSLDGEVFDEPDAGEEGGRQEPAA